MMFFAFRLKIIELLETSFFQNEDRLTNDVDQISRV